MHGILAFLYSMFTIAITIYLLSHCDSPEGTIHSFVAM